MSATAAYLTDLEAAVGGPRRVRRDLVQEVADHLADATDALVDAGYERSAAERRAVADFGSVRDVAPGFRVTVAVASARRTALLLFAWLVVQPLLWDGPIGYSLVEQDVAVPDGWFYASLDRAVEVVGVVTLVVAVLLVVATGIGNRWFHAGYGIAWVTSAVTLVAAPAIAVIGMLMMLIATPTAVLPWAMWTAFVVVPMFAATSSARRTLAVAS